MSMTDEPVADEGYSFGWLDPIINRIFGSSSSNDLLEGIPYNQRPVMDWSLPSDQRESKYNIDLKRAAGIPMGGYYELGNESIPESFTTGGNQWLQGRGPVGDGSDASYWDNMVQYDNLLAPSQDLSPVYDRSGGSSGVNTVPDYQEYADFANMFGGGPHTTTGVQDGTEAGMLTVNPLEQKLLELEEARQLMFDNQRGAAASIHNRSIVHLEDTLAKSNAYYDGRDTEIEADYDKYGASRDERFDSWYSDNERRQADTVNRATDMGIELVASSNETEDMLRSQQASSIDYLNTIEGIAKDVSRFARNQVDIQVSDAIFRVGLQYESQMASINAAQQAGQIDALEAQIAFAQEQEKTANNITMISYALQQFDMDPEMADTLGWLSAMGVMDTAEDFMGTAITSMFNQPDAQSSIDISQYLGQPAGTTYADSKQLNLMQQLVNLESSSQPDYGQQENFILQSPEGYELGALDLEWMLKNPMDHSTLIDMGQAPPWEAYDPETLNAVLTAYMTVGMNRQG